jgi:predicted membrane channel-forming protein YqfA (hemolysin III family)
MRFFACFSAAMVWGIAVLGVASWVVWKINPDRLDASFGDIMASMGVLAVAAVLMVAGFVVTAEIMLGRNR